MKCNKCQNEIVEGGKFCIFCGTPVEEKVEEVTKDEDITKIIENMEVVEGLGEDETNIQANTGEEQSVYSRKSKHIKILEYVLLGLVIGLVGVLCFVQLYKGTNKVEEVSASNQPPSVKNVAIQIKMLEFEKREITLDKGEVKKLQVKIYPTEAKDQELIWSSSNPNAIKIDENGLITCLNENEEAIITVKDALTGDINTSCKVKTLSEKESFLKNVHWLNTHEVVLDKIDIYERLREPQERDYEATWDSTMFYKLEDIDQSSNEDGIINGYTVEKKQLINASSGNLIEYEIYTNPTTKDVNKIVSIEYIDDYLEIVDYYYEKGKVNFIFKRTDSVYTPTYASPDKVGQRYYFNEDSMVKWRVIHEPLKINDYALKAADDYKGYETLSDDLKKQYDQYEVNMLNAAYNTYNTVLQARSIGYIRGYVTDIYGDPVKDASVKVISPKYEMFIAEYMTDSDGYYNIPVPANGGNYSLVIHKSDYIKVDIYDVMINSEFLGAYQENVYLIPDRNEMFNIQILLSDAFNKLDLYSMDTMYYEQSDMARLGYATVNIRKGINNKKGDIYSVVQSDDQGYIYTMLPAGTYTGEIISDGYATSYFTIVSKVDGDFIQSTTTPLLSDGEMRIVLTWGDYPRDLDSHLFTPYKGAAGDMEHIGYSQKSDINGNNLDVDDISSYGPETMTIQNLEDGSYKYYVADYTNCSQGNYNAYDMSFSSAKVSVYTKDGLVQVFNVPRNKAGVIWEVFEIRNKKVVPVQRYYNSIEDKPWWNFSK